MVRSEAERLGVADHVIIMGKVSDKLLRSAFAGAGVFVSVSEHEGFGVPILEAMAAGVPVVAYGAAAIPETMSGAGIMLHTKDPAVVAASVQAIQSDPELRQRLIGRQLARIEQVRSFDSRALLRRVIDRASGVAVPLEIQIQGPFETSYSLAVVNRQLAVGLDRSPRQAVSIYATEGPGDYEPAEEDLERHPEAAALFARSAQVPFPDVVIRQMYPPRVIDTPGGITCEYFGWEESRVPDSVVADFNRYLDGVGVMSVFVRDVLRDCGVNIPIRVVGNGVEIPDPTAEVEAPELVDLRSFTFLHISSAFPRKGVDVLLESYYAAFDGTSDVSLVLKTFPNPHNQVGEVLDRLRSTHPNPPDVRWIDRDLDDREIEALYGLADCYVHPARGEGFGLPVAEAMAAGVPVISVAYSGLADFVSEETAVTIPYTLEQAQTHLDLENSIWAEPDGDMLTLELQRMVDDADGPAVRARVAAARELITTRFSWDAAVGRWEEFIADLEDSAEIQRVAMVTTWNSRCGIAENTRYIVEHSRHVFDFDLFADIDATVIDPVVDLGVSRTWKDRWTPDLSGLEDELRLTDAEVLHVQFNFGFFEFQRMADLIERQLEKRGVVVTLHRTRDYDDRGELLTLRQIASTLSKVDRLIVHQESDARFLAEMGLQENVTVVPIGAAVRPGALAGGCARLPRARVASGCRHVRLPAAPQGHPRTGQGDRPPAGRVPRSSPPRPLCPLSTRRVEGVRGPDPGRDRRPRHGGHGASGDGVPLRRCGPNPAAGDGRDRAPLSGDRGIIQRRPQVHPATGPAGRRHRRPHLRRLTGRAPGGRRRSPEYRGRGPTGPDGQRSAARPGPSFRHGGPSVPLGPCRRRPPGDLHGGKTSRTGPPPEPIAGQDLDLTRALGNAATGCSAHMVGPK